MKPLILIDEAEADVSAAYGFSDRTLEEALHEHICAFAGVSQRTFRKAMSRSEIVVMLDGVDEIWRREVPNFSEGLRSLRERYPDVKWILSLRSNYPSPVDDLEVVQLRPPSASG